MSGRRNKIDDPRLIPHTSSRAHSGSSVVLQDRIAIQHREIQSLLLDNQRLAATHVALKQELAVAQLDLLHLSSAAPKVQAEREDEVREVYDRSLKMDTEVRKIDEMSAELVQVRADVQKLSASRKELTAQLQAIDEELKRARSESLQVPAIKTELETMRKEIQRGRAAIEYEKKTHASNLEQSQAMKKNMISMAREVEKLHAELANAEKRARAAAAAAQPSPGYPANYINPDVGYGGNSYPDPYGMDQAQGATDAGPQYVSEAMPHAPYDMQRTHVHR